VVVDADIFATEKFIKPLSLGNGSRLTEVKVTPQRNNVLHYDEGGTNQV
jgi:hypothetical protein